MKEIGTMRAQDVLEWLAVEINKVPLLWQFFYPLQDKGIKTSITIPATEPFSQLAPLSSVTLPHLDTSTVTLNQLSPTLPDPTAVQSGLVDSPMEEQQQAEEEQSGNNGKATQGDNFSPDWDEEQILEGVDQQGDKVIQCNIYHLS